MIGKKILLASGALFFSLLVAEMILRLLGIAPGVNRLQIDLPHGTFQSSSNAVLRYEPRPGSPGVSAYGIRDHDYDIDKPEDTLRLIVIGDSIGYGFCNDSESLPLEDLFMKRLEQMLGRDARVPVEVINLSVSGYDSVQEVEFLKEKGLALDPDIVLVAYCLNDDFDASMELQYFKQNPQFGIDSEIGQRIFLSSHLVRLVWLRNWKPEPPAKGKPQREAVSRTEKGFEQLASLARRNDFQPLVVVFPLFESIDRYRWHRSHQRAAAIAGKYGLPVLDLLDNFVAITGGDLKQLQGRCSREHPDERGHEAAAHAIDEYLREAGMIRLP